MLELAKEFAQHGLPGLIILLAFVFSSVLIKRVFDVLASERKDNEKRFNDSQHRHEERVDSIFKSHKNEVNAIMDKHKDERDEWRNSATTAIKELTEAISQSRRMTRSTDLDNSFKNRKNSS